MLKLKHTIGARFPRAYDLYSSSPHASIVFKYQSLLEFFLENGIELSVYENIGLKHSGTFTCRIVMSKSVAISLDRKNQKLSYHYHSTIERAKRKGILKSFEIIERLINGLPMEEKLRGRNI